MLPFMKPKQGSAVLIVKDRKPDSPTGQESHETGDELHELEECATDLARAIEAKDMKRLAQCLKMIHEVCQDLAKEPEINEEIK